MFEFLKNSSSLEKKISELEARIAALEKQNKELTNALEEAGKGKKSEDSKKAENSKKAEDSKEIKEAEKTEASEKAAPAKLSTKARRAAEYEQDLKVNIPKVMEKTGWSREYAEAQYLDAKSRTKCSPKEYYMYGFYDLDNAAQEQMFLRSMQRKLRKKYDVSKDFVSIICNKEKTNLYFSEYVRRPWCVNTKASFKEFQETFKNTKRIMYKPTDGHRGFGIEAFYIDPSNMREVYNKLKTYPEGVVEEFVTQHPEMSRLSPASVNSLRFVTFSSFKHPVTKDGKNADVAYSIVRIGRGDSIVDNLHSGGMVSNVDLETGTLATHGADRNGLMFEAHPESGTTIKGFKVPYFNEARDMVLEAINKKKVEGYLGWDIAISENGPMLLEVNTSPGADGLQLPFAAEKKGMRHVVEKYLYDCEPDRTPEAPYGTKISRIFRDGIEFYWKKPEVADGYEVLRGYQKHGPFEPIALIEKRSIGTYIDSEFDHSKQKVYYTVRSYVNNDDGTRTFSDTVEAKAADFRSELVLERDVTYMYSNSTRQIRAFWGWGEVEDPVWTSDNETVATISSDGVITAVSSGICMLTCASESAGQNASTQVVVDRQAVEPLTEIVSRYQFNDQTGHWENSAAPASNDAVIMMVGDMMCGKRQMEAQCTDAEGWNFNNSFKYVKEITAASDFAIGNLETLLAAGWPYMRDEDYINNTNNCNATSRYLDAVRFGGFDAVAMSNNHNCDGGPRALSETIEQVDRYQLAHTGVFSKASDTRYFIANVNGIKVGYVAYISKDTGFNDKDAGWSAEEKDSMLNVFTAKKAAADIAACRAAGAEYVIAYMHWGFKNFRSVAKHQKVEALAVANAGADYIVGANPHLVQIFDVVTTQDGRTVPCAYSIGNFQAVMNQVTGNRDSVILRIRLQRNADGKVVLAENNYIPCYTYTDCAGNPWAPVAVSQNFNTDTKKKNRKTIHNRIADTIGSAIKEY